MLGAGEQENRRGKRALRARVLAHRFAGGSPAVYCSPAQLLTCSSSIFLFIPEQSMPFMFENLQVYQKAVDFADKIAGSTETFPRGYYFLVDQLNRAALSIATNLAEGNG